MGSTQQPDYRTAIQALGIVAFGAKAATKTFPNSSVAAPQANLRKLDSVHIPNALLLYERVNLMSSV